MSFAEQCPISTDRVGKIATRITAGFVLGLGVLVVWSGSITLASFIAYDFLMRAFFKGKLSPLRGATRFLVQTCKVKDHQIDAAPKLFAARIGFIMSGLILLCIALRLVTVAMSVTCVLMVCAALESVFGFCVGCKFHTIWIGLSSRPKRI